MTDPESKTCSPEYWLHLKDEITQRWQQLPPEHQATMGLVLLQQTLEGEYGPWLRSAIRLMEERESESPFRFLPVIRIRPAHLRRASLTEEEIAELDDEDLTFISSAIVRHFINDVFWNELEFMARMTLDEKPGE